MEAEAKVEDSQKLKAKVGSELLKSKDANSDLKKQLDTVAGKLTDWLENSKRPRMLPMRRHWS